MAGSRKYLEYLTDTGALFALSADESNSEGANVAVDLGNASPILFTLPGNVKPRYAVYQSADGTITRKAYICDPGLTPAASFVDPVSGVTVNLKSINAEQRTVISGVDTGLIDGDAT